MIHGTVLAAICGVLLIVYLARRGRKSLAASAPVPAVTAQDSTAPSVIVYGDAFADDSPRSQQETARRLVGMACGVASVTYPTKLAPKKRSPRKVKK